MTFMVPKAPWGGDLRINRRASLRDRLLQLLLSLSPIQPCFSLSPGPVPGQVDGAKAQASAFIPISEAQEGSWEAREKQAPWQDPFLSDGGARRPMLPSCMWRGVRKGSERIYHTASAVKTLVLELRPRLSPPCKFAVLPSNPSVHLPPPLAQTVVLTVLTGGLHLRQNPFTPLGV